MGAPTPLRHELVRDLDHAKALIGEWDELADAASAGPLSRPSYALRWWTHLGKGRLLVAAVREQERLVALAPLHERWAGPVKVARWLGHGLGTVAQPLVEPGHEDAARALWAALSTPTRVLELVECRADATGLDEVANPQGRGRLTLVRPRDICPVADVEGVDGLDLLRRPSARNLRSNLSRADRRIAESGLVFQVETGEDPASFERLLPEIRDIYDAAEAAHPRQHLLRAPYDGFLLDFMRAEVAAGRAVAMVGRVGELAAVFRFALICGDTLSLTTTRFRPELASFRPGHLLYREVYRWAAVQGLRKIDLLLGASQTKDQWSTGSYDTVDVINGTPPALAIARAAQRTAEVKQRFTATPGHGRSGRSGRSGR